MSQVLEKARTYEKEQAKKDCGGYASSISPHSMWDG